jgi:hypothetical protein
MTEPTVRIDDFTLHLGDCRPVMACFDSGSIDLIAPLPIRSIK